MKFILFSAVATTVLAGIDLCGQQGKDYGGDISAEGKCGYATLIKCFGSVTAPSCYGGESMIDSEMDGVEACEARCAAEPNCAVFSYKFKDYHRCYLKERFPVQKCDSFSGWPSCGEFCASGYRSFEKGKDFGGFNNECGNAPSLGYAVADLSEAPAFVPDEAIQLNGVVRLENGARECQELCITTGCYAWSFEFDDGTAKCFLKDKFPRGKQNCNVLTAWKETSCGLGGDGNCWSGIMNSCMGYAAIQDGLAAYNGVK